MPPELLLVRNETERPQLFDVVRRVEVHAALADRLGGDVFLFVERCRRRAKVLYFDGTGLVLLTKRLFKGRVVRPWAEAGAQSVELTVAELSLFLEGCELAGPWRLSPPAFEEKALQLEACCSTQQVAWCAWGS